MYKALTDTDVSREETTLVNNEAESYHRLKQNEV